MAAENTAPHIQNTLVRMAVTVTALAAGALLFACDRADHKPAGPPEKITIAYATIPETALAQIAQARGYYHEEGLEVTARMHPDGKPALEDLLAGKADFATVDETPVMFAIMKEAKLAVIATIETSSLGNALLARMDSGILTLGDLKGKKIGVTLGTTADFLLDATLTLQGISRKEVEIVDLKAEKMVDALARGYVDAISTFSLYKVLAQKKLDDPVIVFQDKDVYRWTFNIVATQEFIRNHPETIKKLLRALIRAEEFARENPAEAQKNVASFSGIDIAVVREIWAENSFAVTLDQPFILALEDESRWAIKRGLTGNRNVPNYLDFIYFDGLRSINQEAVNILR